MKPIVSNLATFKSKCKEVFHLLNDADIKFTCRAYGWKDNTLLMYQEENFKHMFYVCLNKEGEVDYDRRFIYYIKPREYEKYFEFNYNMENEVVQFSARNKTIKIPLNSLGVIQFKDPYLMEIDMNEQNRLVKELNSKIKEVEKQLVRFSL